jgi:hypothetical protein
MRLTLRFLLLAAILAGFTQGCSRKKGGGYFRPTPVTAPATHA